MIPKETIEKIFETARIDEVVGEFITLKKRGVNYIGLCPFHNEKTPSFTVSPAKGIYKCFGCSAGGNSVNFVMEHEHMSYPEALRYIARKYNIHIEEEEQSPEQIQQDNERESLFVVSTFAQKHFTHNLFNTEEGQAIGLSYFKERGFNHDTIEKFQLGYALDKMDGLLSEAKEKGYNTELLEKTGLIKNRDNFMFDFFRGRVIFPIQNVTGKVIAFGARTLKNDKKEPKYLNSPETEIYSKSKILYGIFQAKKTIIQNDNCFLVEGYTDVVSLYQSGIENAVASSGTSLTTEQIRLIKRYTPNITILYDGDAAGIKASFRGIDMILEEGMNVKVLLFPDGEDPDSFSKKVSTDELKKFIADNTKDFIFFKTDVLLKEAEGDPIKKAGLIKDLVHSIALIPDPITRSVYTKECSRLFEMNEQTLIHELNKSRRVNYSKQYKEDVPYKDETTPVSLKEKEIIDELYPQEMELTRILLSYSTEQLEFGIENENGEEEVLVTTVGEFILNELYSDELEFEHPEFAEILGEFKLAYNDSLILTQKYFLEKGHDSSGKTAIDMIFSPYNLSERWVEKHKVFTRRENDRVSYMTRNAVYSYKLKKVMQLIYKIQEQLKTETNDEMIQYLLEQNTMLNEIKKLLSAELGRVMIK